MRFALAAVVAIVCTARADAQTLLQNHTGGAGWQFGRAVHMTADQNSDGYPDVLVGAPGANSGRGSIRCLSGKFIATSTGPVELWSLAPPSLPSGAAFGSSIIEVATLTGDAATDYLVGAPGYQGGLLPTGALLLVDGATHAVSWTMIGDSLTRFGASIAAVGDQDGDGKIDVAATAPTTFTGASFVHVIRGSSFGLHSTLSASTHSSLSVNSAPDFGAIVASGFDLDHDGRFDVAIGSPESFGTGIVDVCRADGSWSFLSTSTGQQVGERFGAAIDGTRDFNGDGFVDLVVGAPNWSVSGNAQNGRAYALSGAALVAGSSPAELFTLQWSASSAGFSNQHLGASVRATPDLTADGAPDIVVGAPGAWTLNPPGTERGAFVVYSGASGARIAGTSAASFDRLGDAILDGVMDLNLDGFPDIGVAGSMSDNPANDSGIVNFYSVFPGTVATYCTGKLNSAGCTPALLWSGTPDANSASAFVVTCAALVNQRSGLFMYSHRQNAASFQGGVLCVKAPIRRTPAASSGGSPSGADCSGTLAFNFNAHIQSGADPSLVAGAEVRTQVWSRDPASSAATSLSNALSFIVNP